jgi:glycine betaine/choline ABC-type transport system substrate-binding protein
MTGRTWYRGWVALLAVALAIGLAACGSDDDKSAESSSGSTSANAQPGKGKPPITIGAKNFTEEFILGQLYTQALKAKGYEVSL